MAVNILAIDTSTAACSVALKINQTVQEKFIILPRAHNQVILPMIHEILAAANVSLAQIDLIAFSCGPGSFTGIRIAAAIAQGLAVSHDLPVQPISTLLTLAQTTHRLFDQTHVISCIDARMNAVYYGLCEFDTSKKIMIFKEQEACVAPEAVHLPENLCRWVGVGDGWKNYAVLDEKSEELRNCISDIYPHAYDLAIIASYDRKPVAAEFALPKYLRELQYKKI